MVTLGRPAEGGPALLGRYAPLAWAHITAAAPVRSSLSGVMAAYHMGWVDRVGRERAAAPGKLVRPSLCLWACEAFAGRPHPALPLAAAVEWVHNFSLVHDDIIDGDRERRHRETVWSVWGTGQGINVGDAMHALAFELLLAPGRQVAERLRAGHLLAGAVRELVEGQCLDVALEGRLRATPAAYLRMAGAKTGALLGACLEGGALLGGARARPAATLRRAGRLLGLAFQVRDDWLGTWGRPELTGKARDHDLERRKVTYPVLAGYAAMAGIERRRFRALFTERGSASVPGLRAMLEERAADRLAEQAARRYADEAAALARACDLPAASADEFCELALHIASRER